MASSILSIALLSDSDWREKYRPCLPFSFLAGDLPRILFRPHRLESGCVLWQWLLHAAPSPCPPFTASHTAHCGHVTNKGFLLAETQICFPDLKQPCWAWGTTAKWQTSKLVGASSPMPSMPSQCPRLPNIWLLSPTGNSTCILFKTTVIFISCSFCDCYATELNLISVSLLKTVLANVVVEPRLTKNNEDLSLEPGMGHLPFITSGRVAELNNVRPLFGR